MLDVHMQGEGRQNRQPATDTYAERGNQETPPFGIEPAYDCAHPARSIPRPPTEHDVSDRKERHSNRHEAKWKSPPWDENVGDHVGEGGQRARKRARWGGRWSQNVICLVERVDRV